MNPEIEAALARLALDRYAVSIRVNEDTIVGLSDALAALIRKAAEPVVFRLNDGTEFEECRLCLTTLGKHSTDCALLDLVRAINRGTP